MEKQKYHPNKKPIYIGGVSQNETENNKLKSLIDKHDKVLKRRHISDIPKQSKFIYLNPKQSKESSKINQSSIL